MPSGSRRSTYGRGVVEPAAAERGQPLRSRRTASSSGKRTPVGSRPAPRSTQTWLGPVDEHVGDARRAAAAARAARRRRTSRRSASCTASTVASPTGRPLLAQRLRRPAAGVSGAGVARQPVADRVDARSAGRRAARTCRRAARVTLPPARTGQHAARAARASVPRRRAHRAEPEVDRLVEPALVGHRAPAPAARAAGRPPRARRPPTPRTHQAAAGPGRRAARATRRRGGDARRPSASTTTSTLVAAGDRLVDHGVADAGAGRRTTVSCPRWRRRERLAHRERLERRRPAGVPGQHADSPSRRGSASRSERALSRPGGLAQRVPADAVAGLEAEHPVEPRRRGGRRRRRAVGPDARRPPAPSAQANVVAPAPPDAADHPDRHARAPATGVADVGEQLDQPALRARAARRRSRRPAPSAVAEQRRRRPAPRAARRARRRDAAGATRASVVGAGRRRRARAGAAVHAAQRAGRVAGDVGRDAGGGGAAGAARRGGTVVGGDEEGRGHGADAARGRAAPAPRRDGRACGRPAADATPVRRGVPAASARAPTMAACRSPMSPRGRPTAAFFDLDKTIIAKSSTLAFSKPVPGRRPDLAAARCCARRTPSSSTSSAAPTTTRWRRCGSSCRSSCAGWDVETVQGDRRRDAAQHRRPAGLRRGGRA